MTSVEQELLRLAADAPVPRRPLRRELAEDEPNGCRHRRHGRDLRVEPPEYPADVLVRGPRHSRRSRPSRHARGAMKDRAVRRRATAPSTSVDRARRDAHCSRRCSSRYNGCASVPLVPVVAILRRRRFVAAAGSCSRAPTFPVRGCSRLDSGPSRHHDLPRHHAPRGDHRSRLADRYGPDDADSTPVRGRRRQRPAVQRPRHGRASACQRVLPDRDLERASTRDASSSSARSSRSTQNRFVQRLSRGPRDHPVAIDLLVFVHGFNSMASRTLPLRAAQIAQPTSTSTGRSSSFPGRQPGSVARAYVRDQRASAQRGLSLFLRLPASAPSRRQLSPTMYPRPWPLHGFGGDRQGADARRRRSTSLPRLARSRVRRS